MDFQVFLPIEKVDEEKRIVSGYASTPSKDLQGEVVTLDAIKAALPDYMQWANIREMHTSSAVGVTKEANVDDKGLYISAKITDDEAWKKCKEQVYKGFSIGGQKMQKVGDTIKELRLTEISLVDRPANPDCRIDCAKAVGEMGIGRDVPLVAPEQDGMASLIEKFFDMGKSLLGMAKGNVTVPAPKVLPTPNSHEETSMDTELQKRFAAAHKGAIDKAKQHLSKAMECHGKACEAFNALHKCMGKADGVDEKDKHVRALHSHLEKMQDHHELAMHSLSKAASWDGQTATDPKNTEGGDVPAATASLITLHPQSVMTEGHVEGSSYQGAGDSPYSAAAIATMVKAAVAEATTPLTAKIENLTIENATMKGQMSVLERLPAGGHKPVLFTGGGASSDALFGKDPQTKANETIRKAYQSIDPENPDTAAQAISTIIGTRAANPQIFGKSFSDPDYTGSIGK